jgi:L-lactate utilization protein LutB
VQTATGRTRRLGYAALIALVAFAAGIAAICLFTVEAGEFAVVTQFGNPVRVVKAPDITRTRLYLEAMEKILPQVKKYVIDSEHGQRPVNLRLSPSQP